ncbi:phosphopentomutase [Alkalispirochaeta alkalica]|uniref:phosphopentomutase n=1 Tax=Alkalispirochaeta alkalica TaxID=46356 RepID=UPI0003696566|nr:phosphopentomutase [Alkalispirochaeta alkalica]
MMKMDRLFVIVLDSLGVGALPDAEEYGDLGANTLGHIAEALPLDLPVMESLGLGNVSAIRGVRPASAPRGAWGKAASRTRGKDSTVGHWELAGLPVEEPLPTWPRGIDPAVIRDFENAIGRRCIGGGVASGTQIIADLGADHVETGCPIVYTSADSVFQIAAHEEVVGLETLYAWCETARAMLKVGRVIARPFTGNAGAWQRTANRHDYALEAPGTTMLDHLQEKGCAVTGVGKISDLFAGRGVDESWPTTSNDHGMEKTLEILQGGGSGLVFVNLVDFDSVYGHRRDVRGYRDALEGFDRWLGEFLPLLGQNEGVIITADHGCDPIFKGTDHTREYVPLLAAGPRVRPGDLGCRSSFADLAASAVHLLTGSSSWRGAGESFAEMLVADTVVQTNPVKER